MSSQIKDRIASIVHKHGLDAIAYCSAEPFEAMAHMYEQRLEDGLSCEFEVRKSLDEMVDPRCILEGAQSFIVILLPYSPYKYEARPGFGRMASGTASEDYHLVLGRILDEVAAYLHENQVKTKTIVDTSPLSDRAIAVRSGLGIVRRNNMFYHKTYGSYVHIGSLLVDMKLHDKDHQAIKDPCNHCNRCVAHCPGSAIIGDGTINSQRCVSYLTQKKDISKDEASLIGDMIYGCNVCQAVCPANRGLHNKCQDLLVAPDVDIEQLLSVSNAEFKASYGQTSSGWRGKRTLQRNAIVALGNQNAIEHKALLQKCATDTRPIIQKVAIDALAKLQDED